MTIRSAVDFHARYPAVSRETISRLEALEALIRKWSTAINLVSRSTLDQIWNRHFHDSAQLYDLAPKQVRHWADLGSGGGFPGLVIAIFASDAPTATTVTLVESDVRKTAFLAEARRSLGLTCDIINGRIEQTPLLHADVISARALAPLPDLLSLAVPHLAPGGICLFSKGAKAEDELTAARKIWTMTAEKIQSQADETGCILRIGALEHAS